MNTYGTMFKKGNGEGNVSNFAAACTSMANTIGVGSIGGVATVITIGGPGAIFWLWFSAFFGMSTKAYIDFPDITSAKLVTVAFKSVLGNFGSIFLAIAVALFAWTTIVGMYYSCEKSVNYFFGDSKANKLATYAYVIYFILPIVFCSNMKADLLWATTDLLSGVYVIITAILIFGNHKEIFRLFNDFWDRFIPAIKRGENPKPVSYETIEDIKSSK